MMLIHGDNLAALRTCSGDVTLAYLDPPFFTGQVHKTSKGEVAFRDTWTSLGEYLGALKEVLTAIRPLLATHGSVVVHCDSRVNAYVRVVGDEVFGRGAFASEIVWRYRRWPSKTPNFQRVHDTLLRWVACTQSKPRWTQLYEPPAASTLKTWGTCKQLAVVGADGRRVRSSTTAEKSPGVPLGDVWDIGIIAPVSKERVDFPTQKPEALLERLVLSLTHPGDLVLDPYAGSGTTLVVAHKLGRSFVGIDSSAVAVRICKERFNKLGEKLEVVP
jgi:DNA modification methylase